MSEDAITSREAILIVNKTRLQYGKEIPGTQESETERIRVRKFETNPASVSVKAGMTVNLGNYEAARVDFMLTVPCYLEEIEEVFEDAKAWVDARMTAEVRKIRSGD